MEALQPDSQDAHNHHLIKWPRKAKMRTGFGSVLRAFFTSPDPFLFVCIGLPDISSQFHTWIDLFWLDKVFHAAYWQQGRVHTETITNKLSFATNKQQTTISISHHFTFRHFCWTLRH